MLIYFVFEVVKTKLISTKLKANRKSNNFNYLEYNDFLLCS